MERAVVARIPTTAHPDPFWNGEIDLLECGHFTYGGSRRVSQHACVYCARGLPPHLIDVEDGRHVLPTGWMCLIASTVSDAEMRRLGLDPERVRYDNVHRAEALSSRHSRPE